MVLNNSYCYRYNRNNYSFHSVKKEARKEKMKKTNRYLIVRDFEKAVKNDMAAACRLKS